MEPEQDSVDRWGYWFGFMSAKATSLLPRPIRRVLKWPLLAVSLLVWVFVITPAEWIGGLIKRFGSPSS